MATEDKTQTEAEVKPAARKRTTRSRKAAAPQATGEAGAPAASAEAAAPAPAPKKRSTAPRKKAARKPSDEPKTAPPAPVVEKAPETPAAAELSPQEQPRKEERFEKQQRPQKNKQPLQQSQPAAPVLVEEKPAPAERATDIENPDAAPQLPPAPGFAAPETVGGSEGGSGNRRKRRRNRNRNRENAQQPQQQQNTPQVDSQELVRRAWKIFLGEVTEEGLALMDDRTAAEASRRAFRVAEIFLIEAARHRPSATVAEESEAEELPDTAGQE